MTFLVFKLPFLGHGFALLLVLFWEPSLPVVEAWGKKGHEIVANLAWRMLSNHTKGSIVRILQFNTTAALGEQPHDLLDCFTTKPVDDECCPDCSPLACVADWADTVRRQHDYQWSAPLQEAVPQWPTLP
jgi:hypothetical protein